MAAGGQIQNFPVTVTKRAPWATTEVVRFAVPRAIVNQHGLCTLAAIFRDVTYEASQLADVLNQHLGLTTADLEALS